MAFNLERFEYWCYHRQHENACRELIELLGMLDANYGSWSDDLRIQHPSFIFQEELSDHALTRITSAISALFSDPQLQFSPEWKTKILSTHRWFSTLFAASPFRNADHIIRALGVSDSPDFSKLEVRGEDLDKLCILYSPESDIPLDLDALCALNKKLAVGLCVALISPRFLGTPSAHQKRELILPWLTQHLIEIDDIDDLPHQVLHDVYMHCSYADREDKHDVKRSINFLIQKKFAQIGLKNLETPVSIPKKNKPIMLIVLEWFTSGHSIYRTHSLAMEGAKKYFHVVAMGYEKCVDEITKEIFDEFIPIESGFINQEIEQIKRVAEDRQAQILYMPSGGMFPLTMYLTNVRLAPIQAMALGHPATTHSKEVDYIVVEEDYVGDPKCFSEKLLVLPSDGMPYRPSVLAKDIKLPKALKKEDPDIVGIVLCATTMKLNPKFLETCQAIVKKSRVKIHFRFLIGQAQGLIYPQVNRLAKQYLGNNVTVFPHQDYKNYMNIISKSDMFINPFPFGNTNGIIDTVTMGLIGVCKTGREVHEHIDEGLFRRLDFPDWLIAKTNEEYVDAVVRLASNHNERRDLSEKYSGQKNLKKIFTGQKFILGEKLLSLLKTRL